MVICETLGAGGCTMTPNTNHIGNDPSDISQTLCKGSDSSGEVTQQQAIEIFKDAAEQEKAWAKYLFKDGSMIGLNENILVQYVEYITNLRMDAIGLPPIFAAIKNNPIPWINAWLSSDNVQVAPQESEITSYLVGQIDAELSDDAFDDFEL